MCDGKTFFLVVGILLSLQACSSCGAGNSAASSSATGQNHSSASGQRENYQPKKTEIIDAGLLPVASPDRASIADSLFEMMKQIKEKRDNRGVLNHTAPLPE